MHIEFNELKKHIGHNIKCRRYGKKAWFGDRICNVSIECRDCEVILYSITDEELNINDGVTLQEIKQDNIDEFNK